MFKTSIVVAMLLGTVLNSPLELCEVSKVWGEASYRNKENCQTRNLQLNATSFTISGFSSGGFMTANLFAMFNDQIDGVGINAGHGPCASASINCSEPIDYRVVYNTKGIEDKPVFLYSGVNDSVVQNNQTMETADWFEKQGADVKRLWIHDFMHVLPNNVQSNETLNRPYSCAEEYEGSSGSQQCGYNMALEVFNHLYGEDMSARDVNYQDSGELYAIDISASNNDEAFVSDHHFLYVPNACFNQSCRFHMDLHGCTESNVWWNDTFVRQVGYMEHAAANNIIMLFPSTNDTEAYMCWRSSQQPENKHAQINALSDLIESVFDRDLLHQGVDRPVDQRASLANNLSSMYNLIGNPLGNPMHALTNGLTQHINMRKSQPAEEQTEEWKNLFNFLQV